MLDFIIFMVAFCSLSMLSFCIRLYFKRDNVKVKFREEKKAETEIKPIE